MSDNHNPKDDAIGIEWAALFDPDGKEITQDQMNAVLELIPGAKLLVQTLRDAGYPDEETALAVNQALIEFVIDLLIANDKGELDALRNVTVH